MFDCYVYLTHVRWVGRGARLAPGFGPPSPPPRGVNESHEALPTVHETLFTGSSGSALFNKATSKINPHSQVRGGTLGDDMAAHLGGRGFLAAQAR